MSKYLFLILPALLLVSTQTTAMDYMWEEKFAKNLPLAEKKDPEAQYRVGIMYLRGRGTALDIKKAVQWLEKAARQGHSKAQYKLGMVFLNGSGITKNQNKAVHWIQQAATGGHPPAQFQLGQMYESGAGVKRDQQKAINWYTMAADREYERAKLALVKLKQNYVPAKPVTKAAPRQQASKQTTHKPANFANARELLLRGKWSSKSRPALYLPSARNSCTVKNGSIICLSKELKRQQGIAIVTFQTEATLNSFTKDGRFKLAETDILLSAVAADFDSTDEEIKTINAIKLGKQSGPKMSCKFESTQNVTCSGKSSKAIQFTRR